MGFPIVYTEDIFPKIFIFIFSLLGFIRTIGITFFNFMGLPDFLETPYESPFPENPTLITHPGQPIPADQIQEFLPVINLSGTAEIGGGNPPEGCAVCLYEFAVDEEIRWLKNCKHIFHRSCLDRWMEHDQVTCPLCRVPFLPRHSGQELDYRLQDSFGEDFVHGL